MTENRWASRTGSNASLLSRELGSRLSGRYAPVELFPFSFVEFLRFRGYALPDLTRLTRVEAARLQGALAEDMRLGGVPEPLKHPELSLARTLYDDVLCRDIATRHRIEDVRPLKELAFYLMSNPAGLVSFNKLKEQLRLGSVNTVKDYIKHLENSWPIFTTAAELKPKPGTNRFSVSQCSADRKVLENLRKRSYELRLQVAPMVC